MSYVRSLVVAAPAAPPRPAPSFRVCRSQAEPTYQQLSLTDAQGALVYWVLPLPLKQLAKRTTLLRQLPAASPQLRLTCLDTGPLQLVPAHPGRPACLGTDLGKGVLHLHFGGQLLRGYFRLHCLPTGDGHLWQLIPVGPRGVRTYVPLQPPSWGDRSGNTCRAAAEKSDPSWFCTGLIAFALSSSASRL